MDCLLSRLLFLLRAGSLPFPHPSYRVPFPSEGSWLPPFDLPMGSADVKPWTMISAGAKAPCKPFKANQDEQIRLVSSFDWLDITLLVGIDKKLRELVKDSLFIDAVRTDALCAALRGRVERLSRVVEERRNSYPVDDRTADLTEDAAYSGEEL